MYKTTALMLSLMLTSMPVLADCMAQLDRKPWQSNSRAA